MVQGRFSGRILACQTGGPGSIPSPAARVPFRASLVAQTVKNPRAMQETQDQSLGGEDALEKRMATHFSIPAWRIPMERGAWQATVHGVAKSRAQLSN